MENAQEGNGRKRAAGEDALSAASTHKAARTDYVDSTQGDTSNSINAKSAAAASSSGNTPNSAVQTQESYDKEEFHSPCHTYARITCYLLNDTMEEMVPYHRVVADIIELPFTLGRPDKRPITLESEVVKHAPQTVNKLFLDDKKVSLEQAVIDWNALKSCYQLYSVGRAAMWVDGKKVESGDRPLQLRNGSTIKTRQFCMYFSSVAEDPVQEEQVTGGHEYSMSGNVNTGSFCTPSRDTAVSKDTGSEVASTTSSRHTEGHPSSRSDRKDHYRDAVVEAIRTMGKIEVSAVGIARYLKQNDIYDKLPQEASVRKHVKDFLNLSPDFRALPVEGKKTQYWILEGDRSAYLGTAVSTQLSQTCATTATAAEAPTSVAYTPEVTISASSAGDGIPRSAIEQTSAGTSQAPGVTAAEQSASMMDQEGNPANGVSLAASVTAAEQITSKTARKSQYLEGVLEAMRALGKNEINAVEIARYLKQNDPEDKLPQEVTVRRNVRDVLNESPQFTTISSQGSKTHWVLSSASAQEADQPLQNSGSRVDTTLVPTSTESNVHNMEPSDSATTCAQESVDSVVTSKDELLSTKSKATAKHWEQRGSPAAPATASSQSESRPQSGRKEQYRDATFNAIRAMGQNEVTAVDIARHIKQNDPEDKLAQEVSIRKHVKDILNESPQFEALASGKRTQRWVVKGALP
eukprot:gb/GECG01005029.1/.p1 GENE.gb/GECG01005029.1/~~gb/GECG01005029.1/.p1  ORF type:complete len:692 (+),score=114.76 gb/GECG01005029.1/:1-2076(+)